MERELHTKGGNGGCSKEIGQGGRPRGKPKGMAKEDFEDDIHGGRSRRMFMEEQEMWSQVLKCAMDDGIIRDDEVRNEARKVAGAVTVFKQTLG